MTFAGQDGARLGGEVFHAKDHKLLRAVDDAKTAAATRRKPRSPLTATQPSVMIYIRMRYTRSNTRSDNTTPGVPVILMARSDAENTIAVLWSSTR